MMHVGGTCGVTSSTLLLKTRTTVLQCSEPSFFLEMCDCNVEYRITNNVFFRFLHPDAAPTQHSNATGGFLFREPTPVQRTPAQQRTAREAKKKKNFLTLNGGMVVKRSAKKPNTTTHQTLSKFHQGTISAIAIMKGWQRQQRSRKGGGGRMTLVVTGDVSNYPTISLWNGETMEPINSTKGVHQHQIVALSLYKSDCVWNQTLLSSVGGDVNHTLLVHTVPDLIVLHTVQTGRRRIYDLVWYPNPLDVRREQAHTHHRNDLHSFFATDHTSTAAAAAPPPHFTGNRAPLMTPPLAKRGIRSKEQKREGRNPHPRQNQFSYSMATPCMVHVGAEHCVFQSLPSIATVNARQGTSTSAQGGACAMTLDTPTTTNTCAVVYGRALVTGTMDGHVVVYDAQPVQTTTRGRTAAIVHSRNPMVVSKNSTAHEHHPIHTVVRLSNGGRGEGFGEGEEGSDACARKPTA